MCDTLNPINTKRQWQERLREFWRYVERRRAELEARVPGRPVRHPAEPATPKPSAQQLLWNETNV